MMYPRFEINKTAKVMKLQSLLEQKYGSDVLGIFESAGLLVSEGDSFADDKDTEFAVATSGLDPQSKITSQMDW